MCAIKICNNCKKLPVLNIRNRIPSFAKFADKNYYTGQVFVELLVFESTKKSEKSSFVFVNLAFP